jgi:hypothetical protein
MQTSTYLRPNIHQNGHAVLGINEDFQFQMHDGSPFIIAQFQMYQKFIII